MRAKLEAVKCCQRTCKMTKTVAREKIDRIAKEPEDARPARSTKQGGNHPAAMDQFDHEGMGVAAKE